MNDAFGLPQSVVVLGGTSDIAQAVVDLLVRQRCRTVVLAGRDAGALAAAADRARRGGADRVATVVFDALAGPPAPVTVAECMDAAGGPVDLVLVAVGALGDEGGDHRRPGDVADLVTVNFGWPAAALAAAADRLLGAGGGRIVVLSSVAAVRTRPANITYGAAKAGLDAFALDLATALRGTGVHLQVVRPGFVATKMTAGRASAPLATDADAVARAVVGSATTARPVVWVPGLLRWVFAVVRLLPRPLWWRLAGGGG